MSFETAICPSCNKEVQVPTDVDQAACMYCGGKILRGNAGAATRQDTANLLGMARTASLANNNEEAHSYFNRVLEIDPKNFEAWLGKGKAAGWLSTLAHIRLSETVTAFNNAIGAADAEHRAAVAREATDELNGLVATLYGLANNHMLEFVASQGTWESYLVQVSIMLDALDGALIWSPEDVTTLENIIHLCRDNIEGVSYRDELDYNTPKSWSLSPEYEQLLQSKLDHAVAKMRAINPSYEAPQIQKKEADACFVVTATMGDFDHPNVTLLRQLRDKRLTAMPAGRVFISWYYRHGPGLAALIGRSHLLKLLSYMLIVKPAAWAAERILQDRGK